MNPSALRQCRPMGSTRRDANQLALSIRQKLVRCHAPLVVFAHASKIYAVQLDTATGVNILHTPAGNRAWIATYHADATRAQIREDLAWWQTASPGEGS